MATLALSIVFGNGSQRIFGRQTRSLDFYALNLAVLAIAVAFVYRLLASHLGRIWAAIRDDETAARSSGVEANGCKGLAFVAGALLAGAAGALLAHEYGQWAFSDLW